MTLLNVIRALYATVLLTRPGPIVGAALGRPPDERTEVVVRVLGVRQLAQAAAVTGVGGRRAMRAGVVVDGLHAASMVGLAAVDRRRRRAALIDAMVALAFGVAGWAGATRAVA